MKEIDVKKLGYTVPITLIIAFAAYMFFTRNDMPTYIESDSKEQLNGKVDSLFRDRQDHGIKKAVLSN